MEESQLPSKSLSDLESPPTPIVYAVGQETNKNETNEEPSDEEAFFARMTGNGNVEWRTGMENGMDTYNLIPDAETLLLKLLMQKHPDGIWCADLPRLYLREYQVHLNYRQFGFDSSPVRTRNFAPNDVMTSDDKVDKISVVELKRSRKYLGVYVVEVFHPSFFWIHLRENKKDFEQMMDKLSDFYGCNKNKYIIAKLALKKDLNCACIYGYRWHRAIIRSVQSDFTVTVFFYDYGTMETYTSEDIYYLHKQFAFLPAQAIPCGLFKIKPSIGDRWKRSVAEKFNEKVKDILLAATIFTIDPEHNSMMVILTDTIEEEDVHINDWLVNERLAQVGKTASDTVDMASIMRYVQNNVNHVPTYCFAKENLMSDNCCKATSTEETFGDTDYTVKSDIMGLHKMNKRDHL
ncbi:tudor domain-containing protein 5-like [Temnothorax longispinosus]|uniref:tudor domain-containing protein 5-like n=1 Tax=Temnothorax longispinosus TaxID=300112 RepID=UPI003A9A441D